MIKEEVTIFLAQFHSNAKLPKEFTSYFHTLVMKVESSLPLGVYRPIFHVSYLFKLMDKVLVSRLGRVTDALVPQI